MDLPEAMLSEIAIGFGCRKGASAASIAELLREVLRDAPAHRRAQIFTLARKAREGGLRESAAWLGLAIVALDEAEFSARQGEFLLRGATASPKVMEKTGFASVAEAAALMGGGPNAQLIVPRRAKNGATCAVAAILEGQES
jgi:cobalamin biosynthesis protein CbiG